MIIADEDCLHNKDHAKKKLKDEFRSKLFSNSLSASDKIKFELLGIAEKTDYDRAKSELIESGVSLPKSD